MDAKERSAIEIKDQKKDRKSIVKESSLYFDRLFLERKLFLRYCVAIVLNE
jgi:hypothetical protein